MAISKEELIKKINDWRKDKSTKLSDDYLDYLDSYIAPKNISVFAVDDDSGEELDDYTPEFEAAQAEVLNDLCLNDDDIDEIMSNTVESDKPHDKELAGETTPEEDFMQRAAEGKIPATSGVLAGDLTPEEIEMIQMFRNKKQPPKSADIAGDKTPEEKEMLKLAAGQTVSDERLKNITNRLARNLSKHRW